MRLLEIKRQSDENAGFNQITLKTVSFTRDALLTQRTWATVMEQMKTHGKDSTRERCARAMSCTAFKSLQHLKLIETTSDDLLRILTVHLSQSPII